ncbi:alkene reductase [Planosporangium thailandense]|uniref:Alkene reductase n=1 Tax=Planosporangium thailandense TaxID=765197 RepID=A0ABX0XX42_9ACTN|nr:alkene reductase [Planosporangium thailandense]NJC69940.1 alkene reductase [Planosporangium thailandense]
MPTLFDEVKVGGVVLPNRVVMAPLTRNRADRDGVPGELAATYYAQRATAGLIVSEGSQPGPLGQGFVNTPGLHREAQLWAWRQVTGAVHAEGGRIFAQIMHTGRIGHPDLVRHRGLADARYPLAPSAVRPAVGMAQTYEGPKEYPWPREMTLAEIRSAVRDFATAARNAVTAGFDGVELHGANGCLLHQFLADGTNRRTDHYGGSLTGRIRFVCEVTEAVADAIGPSRVGLRVSPGNRFNDMNESDTDQLYPALLAAVAPLGIAYLHVYEVGNRETIRRLREIWPSTFMVNPHPVDRPPVDGTLAQEALDEGVADLISFGRHFISNPDLVERLRVGAALTPPDPSTFYGGDHHGYTDYPAAIRLLGR